MAENKKHILMSEGKCFLDGTEILNEIKAQIVATPDVWEGKRLGSRTKDRRWKGMDYKVTVTEYKSTPWLKEALKKYIDTGDTPEFTFQGIQGDTNSDYAAEYGTETVTATGCVITSDIVLLDLDTDGDVVQNDIEMGAKKVS